MDLRTPTDDEVVNLARIWYDSWQDAHADILPAELARYRTPESFRERMRAHLADVLVAGPRGQAIGFSMIQGDELYQLYVTAAARGTGAAAALLAGAEARLVAAGVERAWLACAIGNERAARFYAKHGWRRMGTMVNRLDTPDGVFELEVWRYEKDLATALS